MGLVRVTRWVGWLGLVGCDPGLLCLPCVHGDSGLPVDSDPVDSVQVDTVLVETDDTELVWPDCPVALAGVPVLTEADACFRLRVDGGQVLGVAVEPRGSEGLQPRLLVSARTLDERCPDGCLGAYELALLPAESSLAEGLKRPPADAAYGAGLVSMRCGTFNALRAAAPLVDGRVHQHSIDLEPPGPSAFEGELRGGSAGARSLLSERVGALGGAGALLIGDPAGADGAGAVWCAPRCFGAEPEPFDEGSPAVIGRAGEGAIGGAMQVVDLVPDGGFAELLSLTVGGGLLVAGAPDAAFCALRSPNSSQRLWLQAPGPIAAFTGLPLPSLIGDVEVVDSDVVLGVPTLSRAWRVPRGQLPSDWSDAQVRTAGLDTTEYCDPVAGGAYGAAVAAVGLETGGVPWRHLLVGDPEDRAAYLYLDGAGGAGAPPALVLQGEATGFGRELLATIDFGQRFPPAENGVPDVVVVADEQVFVFCGEDLAARVSP
jgi:hypothetical protein